MAIPGDASPAARLDEIIRVNHAGEYGAQRIYEGQLAVLGRHACAPLLKAMAEQERAHLATFERLLTERRARPSLLWPLWHIGGFALGAGTALLGPRAAMACTVAVEEVIAEHYQSQLDRLGEDEPELKDTIQRFRAEEMEHHAIGLEQEAQQAPFYDLLSGIIKIGCHAAIAVAKKL